MITTTIIIACNTCSNTFVESGDKATRGTVVPNSQTAGWRYVNAATQICPDCLAKLAAAKAANKPAKVEKVTKSKVAQTKAAKKETKKVSTMKVDAKKAANKAVVVKVAPSTNASNVGVSTGKLAKSAKKSAVK